MTFREKYEELQKRDNAKTRIQRSISLSICDIELLNYLAKEDFRSRSSVVQIALKEYFEKIFREEEERLLKGASGR